MNTKKVKIILAIAIPVFLIVLGAIFNSDFRKFFWNPKTQPQMTGQQIEPVVDNSLQETSADLMQFTFDFQIKEIENAISLSWDQSKIRIFYLILMDKKAYDAQNGENALGWGVSSFDIMPQDQSKIAEQAKYFLFPPYTVGEKPIGFSVSRETGVSLEKGKEYWVQLAGLNSDNRVQFTSKKFVFNGIN